MSQANCCSETNPFSTCRVRPGQLPYRFPAGISPGTLTARLAQHRWCGQLIGPHGVGKTTLLHTWLPTLRAAGHALSWWTVRVGQRRLPPAVWTQSAEWTPATIVVVDGYEQLRRFERWRLAWRRRHAGCGLVVTAHRDVGWPTLAELTTSTETVQGLVTQLLAGAANSITPADVTLQRAIHGSDVRELFFALYDLYEQRRPCRQSTPQT